MTKAGARPVKLGSFAPGGETLRPLGETLRPLADSAPSIARAESLKGRKVALGGSVTWAGGQAVAQLRAVGEENDAAADRQAGRRVSPGEGGASDSLLVVTKQLFRRPQGRDSVVVAIRPVRPAHNHHNRARTPERPQGAAHNHEIGAQSGRWATKHRIS